MAGFVSELQILAAKITILQCIFAVFLVGFADIPKSACQSQEKTYLSTDTFFSFSPGYGFTALDLAATIHQR